MKYNFDEIIDRKNTNSVNILGYRKGIFGDKNISFSYDEDELIRMWIADMDFATPEVVTDAVRKRLDKQIFGYTRAYDETYFASFQRWCEKRYGWKPQQERIVTSSGVVPALFELVRLITEEDEKVMILTPSYAPFRRVAEGNDRELVCSALINEYNRFTINFDDFESKAKDTKTTLFILCNPHNPTGRAWSENELKRLLDICKRHDLWVVSDEIHCDVLRESVTHIPFAKISEGYDKVVTCMSHSKSFNLAGMLMSNVVIENEALLGKWQKSVSSIANPLSIAAMQAAYEHGEDWLREMSAYLDGNFKLFKDFMDKNLPATNFIVPEATYLAWVNVSAYLPNKKDLSLFFVNNAGILLEDERMFVENAEGFVRINIACPCGILQTALERIHKALS